MNNHSNRSRRKNQSITNLFLSSLKCCYNLGYTFVFYDTVGMFFLFLSMKLSMNCEIMNEGNIASPALAICLDSQPYAK